ncbi:MAG: hypothetical protein AABX19_04030 [Nanoarchaeota archaeon]
MKGIKNFFSIFFIFLIILSSVNAFSVSQESISTPLCPRDTGLFIDNVKNTASVPKDFNINSRGSASGWAVTAPSSFVLNPNEEKKVYSYITPSQTTNPGNYNLDTVISTDDDSKLISHSVVVKDCFRAGLAPITSTRQEICPNGIVKYELTLTNNGEFKETFRLSIEGELKDIISISDDTVILDRAESKKIVLYLKAPVESREYEFTLLALGNSGKTRDSIPLTLKVNPCYDFDFKVLADTSYNVCDRSYNVVPLRIENKGTAINTYKLKVDGPVWARSEKIELTLKSNEAKNFNLVFAPTYGIEGSFPVHLEVSPQIGFSKISNDLNILVRKCYGVKVDILDSSSQVCQGVESSFNAAIKNTGEIRKSYKIGLESPSWVSSDTKILNIAGGEEKSIVLKALPTSDVKSGSYDISLLVNSTDQDGLQDKDSLKLDVVSVNECYKPRLSLPYDDVVVYFDSSVLIPVNIENSGVRRASYSLFLSGNAATFSNMNPVDINVDPGKTETAYVYVAPKTNMPLGVYDAKVTLSLKNGANLDSKDMKIEITDNKERATDIKLSSSGPVVDSGSGFFLGVKDWFVGLFSSDNDINATASVIVSPSDDNIPGLFSNYKYYFLSGFIILALIVLFFVFGWHKYIVSFFDDEVVDYKEEKVLENNTNDVHSETVFNDAVDSKPEVKRVVKKKKVVDNVVKVSKPVVVKKKAPVNIAKKESTKKEVKKVSTADFIKKESPKAEVKKTIKRDYIKPEPKAYGVIDSPALNELKEKIDEE